MGKARKPSRWPLRSGPDRAHSIPPVSCPVDHRTFHTYFGDTLLAGNRKQRRQGSLGRFRMREHCRERALFWRAEVDEVGGLAHLKIADFTGKTKRFGTGPGRQ